MPLNNMGTQFILFFFFKKKGGQPWDFSLTFLILFCPSDKTCYYVFWNVIFSQWWKLRRSYCFVRLPFSVSSSPPFLMKILVRILNSHYLRHRKKSMCFWDGIFSLKYTLYCAYFCTLFINIFNIHFSLCVSLITLNKYIKRGLLQNSDEDKSLHVHLQMVEWYPWQKFVG